MSKIKIPFNGTNYNVDESSLSDMATTLSSHLSTVMNGTGATVKLGGTSYNVDATKLSDATSAFVTHLGTIAGTGLKVVVGGVEYSVDSAKTQDAVSALHTVLGNMSGVTPPVALAAGLYDESDNLVASWDELVNGYNMSATSDYGYEGEWNDPKTTTTSPYYVLTNNPELSAGVKLIVANDEDTYRIGSRAFMECTNLTNIKISDSVESIGHLAFCGCINLTSVEIPDSVTSIGDGIFSGCGKLSNVKIGSGITYISQYTFSDCVSLTSIGPVGSEASVEISNNVETISSYAFWYCENLTSVVIPANVMNYGPLMFGNCTKLTSVTTLATDPPSLGYNASFHDCPNLTTIYVPAESIDVYKTASGWSDYADIIQPIPTT